MAVSLDRFGLEGFFRMARRAAEFIRRWAERGDVITVVSHVDADGITAAGVVGACLYRLGVPFRIHIVPWLDEDKISELASEASGPIVFTDIGSSYMDSLARGLGTSEVLVLDHHPPTGTPPPGWVEVNPHNHGLEGSKDVSGAGVAYFVARELDPGFKDLAPLAVVGAISDVQDCFPGRELRGLNELIVKDAVEAGLLEVAHDLVFYGRETRPVHKAMAYTTTPFIPGITYREDNCLAVLAKAGVEVKVNGRWRAVRDLTEEEKRRLLDALAAFLAASGHPPDLVKELVGAVYTLVREEPWTPLRDAREFGSLLNACARMERPDLGVAVCLGDRSRGLEEAMRTLEEYRSTLAKLVVKVQSEPGMMEEREHIIVLHGRDEVSDRIVAALSSIISSGMVGTRKPLVAYAFSEDGEWAKVSARLPPTRPKVNLGAVLREAASRCSGQGGGHDVAAGARVPVEKLEEFLRTVEELVRRQLSP